MDVNKVILIGNVTREPKVSMFGENKSVASFGVATNYRYKDGKGNKAQFHQVTAWGKLADLVGKYIKKGEKLYIDGHLRHDAWTDKNGLKRYTTSVVADQLVFLSQKKRTGDVMSNSDVVIEGDALPDDL